MTVKMTPKQHQWLNHEVRRWQDAGIVSGDQAEAIRGLYDSKNEIMLRQSRKTLTVLMGLSALLVGLAALLLVGYNWDAMPRPFKLAIIFSVVGITHGFSLYLFRKERSLLAEVGFFLGSLFYGTGIWQVAQIFHIDAHYPDGVYWWALGTLPFALLLESRLIHTLLCALLALWAGLEMFEFNHLTLFFGIPSACWSLPLLSLPGMVMGYRRKSPYLVTLYALLLGWWLSLQALVWQWEEMSLFYFGFLGILYLLVGQLHGRGHPFSSAYTALGLLFFCTILIPLTYHSINSDFLERTHTPEGIAISFIMVVAFLGYGGIGWGWLRRRDLDPYALSMFAMILFLTLIASFGANWGVENLALLPTVLANIAMVVSALFLMFAGLHHDKGRPFAMGVLYFLLWAVLRYFDLFGDFGGMPGAAAMFFLCGVVLFYVAQYWRRRKEAIHGKSC